MPTRKKIAGVWKHPADGDNYPTELTMKVTEKAGLGVTTWATKTTGHPEPFGPTEHTFSYGEGSTLILTCTKGKDGTWSPLHAMAPERWGVADGKTGTARELLFQFFTELGYTRQADRR